MLWLKVLFSFNKKDRGYIQNRRNYIYSLHKSFPMIPPSLSNQNSPRHQRTLRSKSRLNHKPKPIYLTDGQVSSSDHTTSQKLSNQVLQSRISRLQKQNTELKQIIIELKSQQYYEIDEQKIKSIVRQNEELKQQISQLQDSIRLLEGKLQELMVENEYLKRSNKVIKQDLERQVKESVRQKHNYVINKDKKLSYSPIPYGDDHNLPLENQPKFNIMTSRSVQGLFSSDIERNTRILSKNKYQESDKDQKGMKKDKIKYSSGIQCQQQEKLKSRSKSRYRVSSKSSQKLLLSSLALAKNHPKKLKKPAQQQLPSTSQSQSFAYKSTSHLRSQSKSHYQPKLPKSRSPNPYQVHSSGQEYTKRKSQLGISMSNQQYLTTDNKEYYMTKRQYDNGSKKKKVIYYS